MSKRRTDPLDYLQSILDDPSAPANVRKSVATVLLPYRHKRLADGGKKDEKARAAAEIGGGFANASAPLRIVKRA